MATQIMFVPGATTSNVSLPAWAPDIADIPTTTIAGWGILAQVIGGTTNVAPTHTHATEFTTRTFNAKVVVGEKDGWVSVVYNAVGELVRT
ncbi:MAG: hypothetical protein JRI71_10155 [Deltaproteobacteria bacterium]|nr:hypothetical protein [Deltaproteobacteria bacterium]